MDSGQTAVPARTYRLTRNFAVACALLLAVAGAGITKFNLDDANRRLVSLAERHNNELAQTLSSSLWPDYGSFIAGAHVLDAQEIRIAPRIAALNSDVRKMLEGTQILKVKIYDAGGLTVFSTEPAQIGESYADNPRFHAAVSGGTSSVLDFRERFNAMAGPIDNRWFLASYIPIHDTGDIANGVLEIYSDVTELRAAMRETLLHYVAITAPVFLAVFVLLLIAVWRADKTIAREEARGLTLTASMARAEAAMRSKTEFIANMSHELRTPLNAIIGFSEMIASETAGPVGAPVYRGYAGDIAEAGKHLLAIINDVLELSRVESGKMEVVRTAFDVHETVGGVVKLMQGQAAEKHHTLLVDCAQGSLIAVGDEHKTRQALINIISNAIKFTPNGGVIRLKCGRGGNDTVVFSVSDNGIGMREEDIPVALSPFGQVDSALARRFEGTGLGLTLSHKFAELMDGTLTIESARNVGTTVTITLPGASAMIGAVPTSRRAG